VKESAGKKKGKNATGHGNPYLARVLGEAAVAARADQHLPGRALPAHRAAPRRQAGHRRGGPLHPDHRLAPAGRPQPALHDLGPGFYDTRINAERAKRNHVRQLEALGYKVTLQPAA
jgi:transposase